MTQPDLVHLTRVALSFAGRPGDPADTPADTTTDPTTGDIAVLLVDNPPVNALSPAVAAQIDQALDRLAAQPPHRALLIGSRGRTFVAGGDIAAFAAPDFSAAPINRTLARLERWPQPVVAALHGFVLGGGLELAMACHWRLADRATQLGLPEITLGLIPGSLGTQRLPRLVGLARAAAWMISGERVAAAQAHDAGLVDTLVDVPPGAQAGDAMLQAALAWLADQLGPATTAAAPAATPTTTPTAARLLPRPTRDRPVDTTGVPAGFFDRLRAQAYADRPRFPAALLLVDALQASTGPFDTGDVVEARGFELLRQSAESQALRHLFFAQRQAARRPAAEQAASHAAEQAHLAQATLQAAAAALAAQRQAGVAPARLAQALAGFGFGPALFQHLAASPGPGLQAPAQPVPGLAEPALLLPLLDAVVDSAARLLDEGRCRHAADVDVYWTQALGFPAYRGGPLYNADASGLGAVVDRLVQRGVQPAGLLRRLVASGQRLCDQGRPGR